MSEEESKSNIHKKQRYFIDQQNSIQGQTLKAMCHKNDELDYSEYERNNEIYLSSKGLQLDKPEYQVRQFDQQSAAVSQQEFDFKSQSNILSPKRNQALTKFQNDEEETIEYKNLNQFNLKDDKRLSQSLSYVKSPKGAYYEKDFNRQFTTKSIIKQIRSFNSLNSPSFNYLESQNKKFYEKVRNKMKYFYLNATLNGRTKLINLKIRNQINDISDFIPEKFNRNIFKIIEKYVQFYLGKARIPIINPQSYFGFFIKITFTIISCLFLFFFSLQMVYSLKYDALINFMMIFWSVEIIIKLNTAIVQNYEIVGNRKDIILVYLRLLQSKVNLNLEYYYQQDFKKLQEDYEQVLGKISLDLKNNLLKEFNRQIINKIQVLTKKFSQSSLDKLSITLKEDYYFPNQAIFTQHDLPSTCIIYVVSGQVEISPSNNNCEKTKILLNSGQFYGLIEFFTGVSNNLHIYSKQFSQVIFIDRKKFIEIIKQDEKDFQEFHQLKDQIFLYGQFDKVKLECSICKIKTHQNQSCHLVHFDKSYFKRKLGYQTCQKQNRIIFARKKEQKEQFFAFKSQQQKEIFLKYAKTFRNLDESYSSSCNQEKSFLTQTQQDDEGSSTIQNNNSVFFTKSEARNNTFKSQNPVSEQKIKKTISQTCLSKIENDLNPQMAEERNKKQKLSLKIISEINENQLDKNHLKRNSNDLDIIKQEVSRISKASLDSQHNQKSELAKNYVYDSEVAFSTDQRIRTNDYQKTILINDNKYSQSNLENFSRFLLYRAKHLRQTRHFLEDGQQQDQLIEFQNNPWLFESLENFKYYFVKGNSYNILKKLFKQKKEEQLKINKQKQQNKMNLKAEEDNDIFHKNQLKLMEYQQSVYQDREIKDLIKQEDVSCWSETQKSIAYVQDLCQQKEQSIMHTEKVQDSSYVQTDQLLNLEKINTSCINQKAQFDISSQVMHQQNVCISKQSISSLLSNRLRNNSFPNGIENTYRIYKDHHQMDQSYADQRIKTNLFFQKQMNLQKKVLKHGENSNLVKHMFGVKKKIVYFFKAFTSLGRKKQINNHIKTFINDKSDYIIEQTIIQTFISAFIPTYHFEKFAKAINLGVIDSQGNKSKTISFIFIVYNSFFSLFLSLSIVFGGFTTYIQRVFFLTFVVWIIESLIQANSTLFIKTKLVTCRSDIINHYVKKRALQQKINLSLEYYYNSNKSKIHQESFIVLEKISQDLKIQLTQEFNRKIINKISILKSNFTEQTLERLSSVAKEEYYLPNQIIHSQNQKQEASLIFVISGLVEIENCQFYNLNFQMKTSPEIKKGEVVGQVDLFTGINQFRLIKSSDYTQILRITNSDMIKSIKEESRDFEKFCQIKDKILMYEQYSYVEIKCQVCEQSTHQIQECPFVHIQKHSANTRIGLIKSEDQERKVRARKKQKTSFFVIDKNAQIFNFLLEDLQVEEYLLKVNEIKIQTLNKDLSCSEYDDSEYESFQKFNEDLEKIEEENESEQSKQQITSQVQYNSSKNLQAGKDKRCSINIHIDDENSSENRVQCSEKNIKQKEKYMQQISFSNRKIDQIFEGQKSDINLKRISADSNRLIINQKVSPIKEQIGNPQNYKDLFNFEQDDSEKKVVKKQDMFKQNNSKQFNVRASQIIKLHQLTYQNVHDDQDFFNPWNFERLQDYKFYFKNGNSGLKIQKYAKYQSKKLKKFKKIINNKVDNLSTHKAKQKQGMDLQIELEEEDSLHRNQQSILQQQQNFSNRIELKKISNSEDISCWSETQNSLFNHQSDKSQIESYTNNVTIKTKENQIMFTEDMSVENQVKNEEIRLDVNPQNFILKNCEGKNKQNTTQQVLNQRQNNLNLQDQCRNEQANKIQISKKEISLSGQKVETLKQNCIQHVNNNNKNNNSKASLKILGTMLKIKLKISYFFRGFTSLGRSKSMTNTIKKYINDKSYFFEDNKQLSSSSIKLLPVNSWIEEGIDIAQDWWLVYFQSLYWALTLMTTGSNIATTTLQIIFTSSTMIFTTIAFGYLLNVVGFILETIDKQSEQKRSDINILNEYMRKKHISKSLQQKINVNLEYYYNRNIKQIHQDSLNILDKIPSDLKFALNKEFNQKIISKISVIKDNFSEKTIDKLCQVAKEEYYLPNQIISDGNQTLETSLICIVSGSVEVTQSNISMIKETNNNQLFSTQIQKGSTCCEIDFFTGVSSNNIIKSTEYTHLLRISRSDFINIVREHSKEIEVFCQIRDRILIYEQYSCINIKCQVCSQNTHLIQECPMVHFQKNFTKIKLGFTKSQYQIRKKSDRKQSIKRKFHVINQSDEQYCIFQQNVEVEDYYLKVLSNYLSQQNKENSDSQSESSEESLKSKTNEQIFLYSIIEEDEKELENQKRKKSNGMISYNTTSKVYDKNKKTRCSITQYIEESQGGDSFDVIQPDSDKCIQSRDKNKQFQHVTRRRSQDEPKSEQNLKLIEAEKPISLRNSRKIYTNQLSSQSNFQQLPQLDGDEEAQRNHKKHEIALKQYSHDLTLKQYSHDLTFKQISSLQSNIKSSQNNKLQKISSYKLLFERDNQYYWNFDKLQDYNHYFKNGNSGLRIQKLLKFQMKMQKKAKKICNK
ncbi:hypothetical protein ABPG73_010945 [Tetrahymena malaccensis]